MAGPKTPASGVAKFAAATGTTAAIMSAIALSQKVAAAGGEGTVTLDPAIIQLLTAMADTEAQILAALQQLSVNVQGWPPNRDDVNITRIQFPTVGAAIRLPDWDIPSGFSIQCIAWPLNAGIILVGEGQANATNPNQSVGLARGGSVGFHINNAKILWASATAANDSVIIAVERG